MKIEVIDHIFSEIRSQNLLLNNILIEIKIKYF